LNKGLVDKLEDLLEKIRHLYDTGKKKEAVDCFREFLNENNIKEDVIYRDFFTEIIEYCNDWLQEIVEIEALYLRGLSLRILGRFEKAVKDFSQGLDIDPRNILFYNSRGITYRNMSEYDKSLKDLNTAIIIDSKHAFSYYNRGRVYLTLKNYLVAIKDFDKTIELNSQLERAFRNRGDCYFQLKKFEKSILDYGKAIKLKPLNTNNHRNRGISYYNLAKIKKSKSLFKKAEADFTQAIRLDKSYGMAFYNRALTYNKLGEHLLALKDFKSAVRLPLENDFQLEYAQSRISELERRLETDDYQTIGSIVDEIKGILQFDGTLLTHYTGLSAAKALIFDHSPFRLSQAAFLNDPSEGKELFNYLSISRSRSISQGAFIASFVLDKKNDNLTMWRMYGKEGNVEANGCSLTLDVKKMIVDLKVKMGASKTQTNIMLDSKEVFPVYYMAYKTMKETGKFLIPGKRTLEGDLNKALTKLKKYVAKIQKYSNEETLDSVKSMLMGIAYLFKIDEYKEENEVRLVISGVGFEKMINTYRTPPSIYVELIDISKFLEKITLGPRVEHCEEWMTSIYYTLDKQKRYPEIKVSSLPYK